MSQNIKKNIIITFISQIIILGVGIFTSIILARGLAPEGRGIYALIALVPALMLKLGTLGIESSNIYFTAKKKYSINDIVGNSFFCSILFGLILILLFYPITHLSVFQHFVIKNKLNLNYIYLLVFTLPLSFLTLFLRNILLGNHNIKSYNFIGFLENIVQFLLFFILLVILKKDIFGAILAYLVIVILGALITVIFVKKYAKAKLKISFSRELFYDMIQYGYKGYLGNLAQFLNYRLDMFFVGFFLGAVEVGYYAIAVAVVERLWLLPQSIATVLFPKVSSINEEASNMLTPLISRNTFFITISCSIVLIFLAKPFIKLFFGASFLPSYPPIVMLLPGIVALSVSKVLSGDILGRGKPQIGMVAAFLSLIINIPLNIYLIPKYGISGAAYASSFAYIIATGVVIYYFIKLTNSSLADILLIKKQDFENYLNFFKSKKRIQ